MLYVCMCFVCKRAAVSGGEGGEMEGGRRREEEKEGTKVPEKEAVVRGFSSYVFLLAPLFVLGTLAQTLHITSVAICTEFVLNGNHITGSA